MVDTIWYHLAAFFGSVLAVGFINIAEFYRKWVETKEVANVEIIFEKRFMFSAGISVAFALFAGLLSFDTTEQNIDYNATIFKVFASAFIAGVAANFGINRFMKPSSTVMNAFKEQKQELEKLRYEVMRLKDDGGIFSKGKQ